MGAACTFGEYIHTADRWALGKAMRGYDASVSDVHIESGDRHPSDSRDGTLVVTLRPTGEKAGAFKGEAHVATRQCGALHSA